VVVLASVVVVCSIGTVLVLVAEVVLAVVVCSVVSSVAVV